MPRFLNMVRMATPTIGTGSTIQLGPAVEGFNTFADGGAVDGDVIYCAIEEKTNDEPTRREVGIYTYRAAGPSFITRTVYDSTDGGNPIDLKGGAQIFSTPVRQAIFAPGLVATLPSAAPTITILTTDLEIGIDTSVAPTSCSLPSASGWLAAAPPGLELAIFDYTGNADVNNISFVLNGTDVFVQGISPVISNSYGLVKLRPILATPNKWYVRQQ